MSGPTARRTSSASPWLALAVAVGLNLRGLAVGKWLHNLGAVGLWIPGLLLIVLAVAAWSRFGSATEFTADTLMPSTRLKDILFWSTIAFSLTGLESASMLGEEIKDARQEHSPRPAAGRRPDHRSLHPGHRGHAGCHAASRDPPPPGLHDRRGNGEWPRRPRWHWCRCSPP